jgi:formate dehydrogenase major subunit
MPFPDQVETNILTIDAVDPKSGTAEFKAAAIRVEKLDTAPGGPRDTTMVEMAQG